MDTFIAIGGRWVRLNSIESVVRKPEGVGPTAAHRVHMRSGDYFYVEPKEYEYLSKRLMLT